MRRDQRGQVRIPTAQQHRGPTIVDLRQTETAVLFGNLNAERTHGEELFDIILWNFSRPIDLISIHLCFEIGTKFSEKSFTRSPIVGALLRERKDAVEIKP